MNDRFPIDVQDFRVVRASPSNPKRVVALPEARIGALPNTGPYPEMEATTSTFSNTVIEADSVVSSGPAVISVIPIKEET